MRGTRLSRFTPAPQLAEDRPEEPNPPREDEPEEPHEVEDRLEPDDDGREDEDDHDRPAPLPEPHERCVTMGP
jgi:hypothetical protein